MERKKPRLATPLGRKFHIDGEEWTYRFGSRGKVLILAPDRKTKYLVDEWDIQGIPPDKTQEVLDQIDEGMGFSQSPGVIKEWVEKNVLGRKPKG